MLNSGRNSGGIRFKMQHHGSILYSIKTTEEAERMLRYMERSTIYYLKQKGWTNVQIAEFTGHHRDTVARVLREEVEKQPKTRHRSSAVAVFDAQIAEWLEKKISVSRILAQARADGECAYSRGAGATPHSITQ